MDIHENARTTPRSRMLMIERLESGLRVNAVAAASGVDQRTVRKWRDRALVATVADAVKNSKNWQARKRRLAV